MQPRMEHDERLHPQHRKMRLGDIHRGVQPHIPDRRGGDGRKRRPPAVGGRANSNQHAPVFRLDSLIDDCPVGVVVELEITGFRKIKVQIRNFAGLGPGEDGLRV